jgi:hypothetical protein
MYINMEVKLLGLIFRVEVVVLCILLGWILGAHLFCSCVKITPYEGFQMIKSSVENMMSNASFLDYKMSAGIELKKNPEKEVVGFMEDFKKDHESIGFQSSCKA